jgi:Heterokaryon incompatibility protein (HET)
MSEWATYDALPRNLPREVRSKLLEFEPNPAVQKFRHDRIQSNEEPSEGDAVIPGFKYNELPSNKKRIRLLRLYPGVLHNPQIDCELFEAEFDDDYNLVRVPNPEATNLSSQRGNATVNGGTGSGSAEMNGETLPSMTADSKTGTTSDQKDDQVKQTTRKEDIIEYEALSWRWGDERHGEFAVMIHKDGALYRKRVSKTLGLALKYLRYKKDRYMWIDAICINQEDDNERSSQVSMMSLVYTGAKQVCVWLGEDDEESTMAIRFIREEIRGLKNFDRLCTDKQHAPKWRALLVLMQRAWFSRRWVVQEVVLAREATVYCGPDEIPWRELAIAVELFVEVETVTHRLSELMKKDEKVDLIPNWFEHISELGASILVNATARVFRESRYADGALTQQPPSHRSLLSLEYLVTSLSIFDCGRPHDSVYALVAVARDARPIAPPAFSERTKEALVVEVCSHFLAQKPYVLDYNSPYADVCKDFIHFCILRCASTDKIQALNILCRPWAKDWRPGEDNPQNPKSNSQDSKVIHPKSTLIKHKGPWEIRANVGELKKKLKETGDHFADLLKEWGLEAEMEGRNDDEVMNILDKREFKGYWNDAREKSTVRPSITRWFPAKKTLEASKNEPTKTEEPKVETKTPRSKRAKNAKKIRQAAPEGDIQKENELGLPSWVARITAAPFDIFPHPGMDMVKLGRKNADPLAGIPQDGHRNYSAGQTKKIDLKTLRFRRRPRCNHYSLYVKGFWFDTVDEVAQVSQGGAIPGTWLDLAGWSSARRPRRAGADIGDPPDEFWRTLVADRGRHDRNPPYYYARACKETIIKGGLRSGAVDTTALIYNERNSIVAEFCRRVQAVIWNRALIKTEKGALGLASDKVREGDKICIIYGCTVPIILRKGEWKTEDELNMEKFEDGVEAMKSLMRKCEKNRARKAQWEKSKKTMPQKELDKIQKAQKDFNNKIKPRGEEEEEQRMVNGDHLPVNSDNESDDDTDLDSEDGEGGGNKVEIGNQEQQNKMEDKQEGTVTGKLNKTGKDEPGGPGTHTLGGEPDFEMENKQKGKVKVKIEDPEDYGSGLKRNVEQGEEHKHENMVPKPLQRSNTVFLKRDKQQKADARDIYRHYEFLGEAYIHGMMDGEAVRQNFYKLKPDHIFEIR